jgi:hypothetical protein
LSLHSIGLAAAHVNGLVSMTVNGSVTGQCDDAMMRSAPGTDEGEP